MNELCGWLIVRFDKELMIEEVWTKVLDGPDNGKKFFFPTWNNYVLTSSACRK